MKKLIAFFAVVAILTIAYLFSQNEPSTINTAIDTPSEKRLKPDENPVVTEITLKPNITQPPTPSKAPEESTFYAVNKLSDKAKAVLNEAGVLPTDLNNEAYIEFDLPSLRSLEAGDNFELLIPQSTETFIAEVTFIDVAGNGDKSIFGNVTGADGRFHTTVLTVGKDAVYGQLTAPSGNYVFESKDQYGWIAAKRDLYKKHVEFEHSESEHHSDAQHPEQEKSDLFAPKLNNNDK